MIDRCPFPVPTPDEKPNLGHVLYWIWEREAIRIAKENNYQGELTADLIFKQYRFCNVRRKDDRVSKWIIANLLTEDYDDMWLVAAIARFVNWPPTLQMLKDHGVFTKCAEDFDRDLFCELIEQRAEDEEKVWTGAYMVRAVEADSDKKSFAVAKYLQSAITQRESIRSAISENSVRTTVSTLQKCYGFGTFMSGQVAADLTYTPDLAKAKDLYLFAPMGPGSVRGLNRLYGKPLRQSWNQDNFDEALIAIRIASMGQLDIEDITLHDIQNCMCEVDKYWRTLYGEGRPRSTYQPETRF